MKTYQKQPRIKNKKITNSAKGEDCTLRIAGVCNFDPKTTVFAHMNGGGMGYKHHDIHGCYACSDCHDWLDSRVAYHSVEDYMKKAEFNRAMIETQNKLIAKGLIKI
jgi:hypothetical protein